MENCHDWSEVIFCEHWAKAVNVIKPSLAGAQKDSVTMNLCNLLQTFLQLYVAVLQKPALGLILRTSLGKTFCVKLSEF